MLAEHHVVGQTKGSMRFSVGDLGVLSMAMPPGAAAGDAVVLWRRPPYEGVVAIGTVTGFAAGSESDNLSGQKSMTLRFDTLLLSSPLDGADLSAAGLEPIALQAAQIPTPTYRRSGRISRLMVNIQPCGLLVV
jgi:hypothetical protein